MEDLLFRNQSVEQLLATLSRGPDAPLRAAIIERHRGLVGSLARKFARPGIQVEDLVQVGWIALIGAVDRFDPNRGAAFATYAVHCIVGEIKRHFRDRTWALKVPPRLKAIAGRLPRVQDELCRKLQRQPLLAEMAEGLRISEEELIEAMAAYRSYEPHGLADHPPMTGGGRSMSGEEVAGLPDPRLERVAELDEVRAALGTLDPRGQTVIRMRFLSECSQLEVARAIGCSQVHAGRLERSALSQLRQAMRSSP